MGAAVLGGGYLSKARTHLDALARKGPWLKYLSAPPRGDTEPGLRYVEDEYEVSLGVAGPLRGLQRGVPLHQTGTTRDNLRVNC